MVRWCRFKSASRANSLLQPLILHGHTVVSDFLMGLFVVRFLLDSFFSSAWAPHILNDVPLKATLRTVCAHRLFGIGTNHSILLARLAECRADLRYGRAPCTANQAA